MEPMIQLIYKIDIDEMNSWLHVNRHRIRYRRLYCNSKGYVAEYEVKHK